MSFSQKIKKFAEKAKLGYDEAAGNSLLGVSRSIIMMTPVGDTGVAQGGWVPSINDYQPTPPTKAGSVDLQKVETFAYNSVGKTYYLTNSVPYIGKLEFGGYPKPSRGEKTINGFSTQAPQGMVRISVENFDKMLDDSINEIK